MKEYKVKPNILTVDWTNALKWDGKRHKIVKLDKRSNLYYASDTVQNLDRGTCIELTNYIKRINAETSFKHLIEMTNLSHIYTQIYIMRNSLYLLLLSHS